MSKSRAEVERLKREWSADPVFDLEDTPGFEAYRAELETFARTSRERWQQQEEQRLATRAAELECSPKTLAYIEQLERGIAQLSEEMASIKQNLPSNGMRP